MDRGHQVPNAVIGTQYGTLAQQETFLMTNICAQSADLNQGAWMRLEQFVIAAAEDREQVFVIAGPIFGDTPDVTVNGPERGIQIPEAFYMILVDTDLEWLTNPQIKLLAYRFPQDTERTADFRDRTRFGVSVNAIEAETGLDFFPEFDARISNWQQREDEVEQVHWQ